MSLSSLHIEGVCPMLLLQLPLEDQPKPLEDAEIGM